METLPAEIMLLFCLTRIYLSSNVLLRFKGTVRAGLPSPYGHVIWGSYRGVPVYFRVLLYEIGHGGDI